MLAIFTSGIAGKEAPEKARHRAHLERNVEGVPSAIGKRLLRLPNDDTPSPPADAGLSGRRRSPSCVSPRLPKNSQHVCAHPRSRGLLRPHRLHRTARRDARDLDRDPSTPRARHPLRKPRRPPRPCHQHRSRGHRTETRPCPPWRLLFRAKCPPPRCAPLPRLPRDATDRPRALANP